MFDADACIIHPKAPQAAMALFRDTSKTITFEMGSGLPGRVWKSGRPEVLTNVQVLSQSVFHRKSLSLLTGLKGAIALPVVCHGDVLGVVVAYLELPLADDAATTNLPIIVQLQNTANDLAQALCRQANMRRYMGEMTNDEDALPCARGYQHQGTGHQCMSVT